MRTATVAITLLSAIIPAAIAAPQGNFIQLQITGKSNISSVAYGEQIQGTDQSNHWVVWIEGKSACPPLQVLGSLVTSPCNTTFQLPGEADNLEFRDCGADNEPNALFSQGQFLRTCKRHKTDTIHCSGKENNVIKHGKCDA